MSADLGDEAADAPEAASHAAPPARAPTSSARSPLGVITLFIAVSQAAVSSVAGWGRIEDPIDRHALVAFVMLFPLVVLGVFVWLVVRHHKNLYAPTDFRSDAAWLKWQQSVTGRVVAELHAAQDKPEETPATAPAHAGAAALRAAPTPAPVDHGAVADAVGRFGAALIDGGPGARPKVLWVDDHHQNNAHERRALTSVGIEVVTATSTDEGMRLFEGGDYSAVISDMARPEGEDAGYRLLERVRARDRRTPFFIYGRRPTPEQVADARRRGASGRTGDPSQLFRDVTRAVLPA